MLIKPESLLVVAGALQCLQLPGMVAGQHYLGWRADLSLLKPVSRRLVVAMGIGIVLYVIGTGCITLSYPSAMAHSELGRAICALQAVAWSVRAVQQFVSLAPLWPREVRWLHRALASIYSMLALSYSALWLVFLKP